MEDNKQTICNLASFNCKSVKRSVDGIRELCKTCHIIGLQETWLLPEEIPYLGTIHTGFGYTGISAVDTSADILRGRPYGGVALLWNTSVFQNVSVIQCSNNRVCAIKIETGNRSIIVISVYMPVNALVNLPDFTNCLGAVSAIISEQNVDSVFILGDFNADPQEVFFNELNDFCKEQHWSCADINILGLNSDTYTFISESHGTRSWLDHCIVTQSAASIVIKAYVKYDCLWSDHFPLVIECNLELLLPKLANNNLEEKKVKWGDRTDDQIKLYNKECHKRLRNINFCSEFSSCADRYCNNPDHRSIIDGLYADIISALSDSSMVGCEMTGGRRRGPRIMGWNKHVGEAHRTARSKFTEWVSCGKPKSGYMFNEMCNSRRVFKSRLKWCQDHQDQIKMDVLAKQHSQGNFKRFWNGTNKVNIRPGLPASVQGISDPSAIADLFKSHFHVHPLVKPKTSMFDTETKLEGNPIIFTAMDVRNAIKSITKGKSPGFDGLSIEHLQNAGPHIARVLAMFYSLCISHSYLPPDLMRTVVVPVVKNKTGDMSDTNNYRPISLATVAAKVFDALLNVQLGKHLSLHNNQFGFRPHLSTESAILSLKHVVRYYTDRSTPIYACFLDLSKAFDMVSYEILWRKLESIKLPQELVNIFKYWYGHQINSVRWAGEMSEEYRLECGVRQGGLTSPSLFNLYINALITELSSHHVGCHVDGICVNNLSYADDMVLLSASVCGLRTLLNTCVKYVRDHGLVYNVAKSVYMVFEVGRKRVLEVPAIHLDGTPLKRVDKFKYLGHIVAANLKDDDDIERERRALCVRANMISRRFAKCSRDVKLTLFRAYCTSLYTCSLWVNYTQKAYNALRVQFNNAFRVVMRLPRFCSASGMFAEARTACFHASMRTRGAAMVRRVRASSNAILAMIADRVDCPYVRHCCDRHV